MVHFNSKVVFSKIWYFCIEWWIYAIPTTILLYLYWPSFLWSDFFHVSKWAYKIDEIVFHFWKIEQKAYRKIKMKQKQFNNRITAMFELRIKSELIQSLFSMGFELRWTDKALSLMCRFVRIKLYLGYISSSNLI